MQRKNFDEMNCPIARTLDRVGEWWSILILRDAFFGRTRFDEFQKSTGIAPNILTRRLKSLVEAGLLEKRAYQERPTRYEYILTDMGRDLQPLLIALSDFGNRYFADRGVTMQITDKSTGNLAIPTYVDAATGKTIDPASFAIRSVRQR
ncbi:DNA-binding HxlR family transcriptional regulator [Pararhizobium capsulatum DSM 1112]|uniref:DNA-binding HxlR family transcriptional regulator n=1 Tax=Pararhizobium capsulatum DSM 1112 TaxID=1121113 RepID=A0ABU0BNS3_9HYPH|nr:helix-turn-helix domain-containing protein [Pararhizobium capsulatum]MDQ0318532.1 DNA-binding HxlR family transcriptional regulator [Pararhizobium capsulatum DSM 1112]